MAAIIPGQFFDCKRIADLTRNLLAHPKGQVLLFPKVYRFYLGAPNGKNRGTADLQVLFS